jgi:hypothetical protein
MEGRNAILGNHKGTSLLQRIIRPGEFAGKVTIFADLTVKVW